jgi:diacylglycerol kinase (ATP)
MTVHVLRNGAVAASAAASATVRDLVRSRGLECVEIAAASASEVATVVARAVDDGSERVIVVGGDGLVHLAIQALATHEVPLGLVPFGTGNDFARSFAITDDDLVAATTQALGPATPIDAIEADGVWVASIATIGFAAAVNARANALRLPIGSSRYTLATLLEIGRFSPRLTRLVIDGVEHTMPVAMIAIANTAYFGGGMAICPQADPTDGLLDVCIVGQVGRLELLRWFPRVFKGTHVDHPAVQMHKVRTLSVLDGFTDTRGDGEAVGPVPRTFRAVPGALRVAIGPGPKGNAS